MQNKKNKTNFTMKYYAAGKKNEDDLHGPICSDFQAIVLIEKANYQRAYVVC